MIKIFHLSDLISLEGLPANNVKLLVLPETTEPAPIKQFSSIIVPGKITEPAPIQAPSLIKIFFEILYLLERKLLTGLAVWLIN